MHIDRTKDLTRRALLGRAAALGGMGGAAPLAMNLASFGEAAAFNATDYKAIVCIFLYGGNDHANTVVPYDATNHALYSNIRGSIAYSRNDLAATALTPTGQTLPHGLQYALSPSLPGLKALFDQGRLGVQLNVGPLITPLTAAQYEHPNRTLYPLPPKLFSHNDQQSVWQALGSEGATVGWGGLMGDLALSSNGLSTMTCISAAGNAVFLSGQNALQYQVGSNGAVSIDALRYIATGNDNVQDALYTLLTQNRTHLMEEEYSKVVRRSIDLQGTVNNAIAPINLTTNFDPNSQNNSLANQLKIIARMIGARNTLGTKRQIYFASLGGFDTHDGLMEDHPGLMARLDEAMLAFYQATLELGVANQVTTFTASDFGRTLASNGDGTDHGWGGHHFIMGGAVNGRKFYGTAPTVSIDDDEQVGQGRLLPTTSVDQFAATLARWFGVSNTELPGVLPNLGNFATSNLGFMV
ncbi:DUF1501 domain-containing protein [Asticcacaulis sp. ZE23SCel15]|uniref:DUF1501 domain-containing protein n=1 Tax=Asticcacaulis sp. ZE23SCel15 TaxID=3059027 RepID=UPI002660146C|nr:DUF1501 domain-containing protein [Asticcacaulis sp. ZE23SCel15]WKL58511.1 DUF1501 domain-containing protein [Asticcacaulis sp. ZE23SCel15]